MSAPTLVREQPLAESKARLGRRSRLRTVLHECGIPVFSKVSVRDYMSWMCRKEDEEVYDNPVVRAHALRRNATADRRCRIFGFGAAIGGIGVALDVLSAFSKGGSGKVSLTAVVVTLVTALFVCLGARISRGKRRVFEPSSWVVTPFEEFSGHVPEIVPDMVDRIRVRLPEASFNVHWFKSDPFLEVVLGRERQFIWVWDEPKFEGS